MPSSVTRRHLLKLLSLTGAVPFVHPLIIHADEVLPTMDSVRDTNNNFNLIVGGNENSSIGQWAKEFADIFTKYLQIDRPILLHYTTGYDGVTASNIFDTRTLPDGNTALITSGVAIVSALAGDRRAHFDYKRWIPIITATSPSITIARQPFHNSIPDLLKNRSMKVGVSTPIGKELPTLLGIELLRINTIPISGISDDSNGIKALKDGDIDVLQLSSPEAIARIPELLKDGLHIFFSLDSNPQYGPSFETLYTQSRHYRNSNSLFDAWKSLALASRIDIAIVLPMLTPSGLVTKWRLSASKIIQNPDIIKKAQEKNITFQDNPKCIDTYTQLAPAMTSTMALRRWITAKLPEWSQ